MVSVVMVTGGVMGAGGDGDNDGEGGGAICHCCGSLSLCVVIV